MAVVGNTASEIGDEILIQTPLPVYGVTALSNYSDVTTGETGTRFWTRYFCYSIDGLFYSDWLSLTSGNLSAIVITAKNSLFINYKYRRAGTDTTGLLTFSNVTLVGTFTTPVFNDATILSTSVFKDIYLYNPKVALLSSVLTSKLFNKGILPESMIRNQTENPQVDDEDFIAFWKTTCDFFTLILVLGEKIEGFDTDINMLADYLEQRDVLFSRNNINLEDLQYIKQNYFEEIRQRGTKQIFERKGVDKDVDGEFLRLIENTVNDELIINLLTDQHVGWWLNHNSPCYKGNVFSLQTIKTIEKTEDFVDLDNYDLLGSAVTVVTDGTTDVALISGVADGAEEGFGFDVSNYDFRLLNSITVSNEVDYEVTFWIKQTVKSDIISFGILSLDDDGNLTDLLKSDDGTATNMFFERKGLNIVDKYYFVRGIIYANGSSNTPNSQLNIGYGNYLRFDTLTTKIVPYLTSDRTLHATDSNVYVKDLKVRPLVIGCNANTVTVGAVDTTYKIGTSFLSTKNLLHITYKNNNNHLVQEDINELLTQKLIPYNTHLVTKEL
jgi:hypothetical protein